MSRLLPRFHATQQRIDDERNIARIVSEAEIVDVPKTVARVTLGGDTLRLRGIPVCTMGVSGTSPNTNPVAALLRSQR